MIKKKMAKGSSIVQMPKKRKKMGKNKEEKKTFSKEKGAMMKKSIMKVKSTLNVSVSAQPLIPQEHSHTFKRSPKKTKLSPAKDHHHSKQVRKPEIFTRMSTDESTAISSIKAKKKQKENGTGPKTPVTQKTEPVQTTSDMIVTKKKKKKKHKVASSAGSSLPSAGAVVAGSVVSDGGQPARLSVAGGFSWQSESWPQVGLNPARDTDSSSDDDDDTSQQPAAKLSRQQLRERAAAEERQLVERERRLMDPTRPPETADDHERLVVAHPDDSSLWIRFMSYFLQATEIEKARGVARRALKTINFREEDEKLNVYIAWLNLESMHGTQETLSNVLHEALQCCDTFKVFTRTAEIHQANSKYDEAETMYSRLVRKLSGNKEAWLRYGVFLMQVERFEAARALMQRALKCLDRRDHVEVISKFAQLEFRFGEPERGKTMFDHLLSTYPKRLDQWNVYINQLIKSSDYDSARRIFQRAATVRLNARRMRSLLKHFLEFEQAHGTAEEQEAVRQMARQYVEARSDADAALLDSEMR